MNRQRTKEGMPAQKGGVAGPRAWDSQPPRSGRCWEPRAGSSAPWPGEACCLPGCSRLPGPRRAVAAGGITPCQAPSQPACVYPAGLGPARFLFAAQGPPVRDRQSPSVLSGPSPPSRRVPLSNSHHPGGAKPGDSPGPTEGKAGVATAITHSVILQVLGWRGSAHAHKYPCELSWAAIHFQGSRALERGHQDEVRLSAFTSMCRATQKATHCRIPFTRNVQNRQTQRDRELISGRQGLGGSTGMVTANGPGFLFGVIKRHWNQRVGMSVQL